ncbi:hypothetical protein [Mycolicibacterium komossense]|uniref:Uncharacterized protein n=1 Tax=Mycolicibacterium komossense TaxID=1779 RepID=A0ABT3CGU4_9MYCO|nr:hypothetical protein [Mycolicibacterium komossense]MCV7228451.1 hypothetical protein [Mycolicibacterium komossense]
MTSTENVIYRYQPEADPAIHYQGIPSGCTGSGADLGAARAAYRGALTEQFGLDRRDLPPVLEHLEAVVEGMWVRTRVGAVHRDHTGELMFLQALLAPGQVQQDLRAQLEQAAGRGLDPVLVIVESSYTVGFVLDQMTPRDTVVVAYPDADVTIGWAVIYGPEAEGRQDIPRAPRGTQLRDMTVEELAHRFGAVSGRPAVRVDAEVLSLAS